MYYHSSTSVHEFTIYWRVGPGGDSPYSLDLEVWFYKYSTESWIKQDEQHDPGEIYCWFYDCPTLIYLEDFDFDTMDLAGFIEDLGGGDYEFTFRLKGWDDAFGFPSHAYHIEDQIVFDFQNV